MRVWQKIGILAVLLCCPASWATTLSGTFKDPSGRLISGKVILRLSHPSTDLSFLIVPLRVEYRLLNGALPANARVTGNDVLQPGGTYYEVELRDEFGRMLQRTNFYITGASYNLAAATPTSITTGQVAYKNPALLDVPNTWTAPQTFGAAAPLTVDTQTVGKWNGSEIVDGSRNVTIAQAIARFTTGNGTVYVPANSTPAAALTISQPNVTLQCLNGATITKGGNFDLLTLSSTGAIVRDCTFDGVKASFTGGGIVLNGASSATVENDTIRNVASTSGSITLVGSSKNKIRNNRISLGAGMGIFGEKNSDQNSVEGNFVDTTAAAALANMSAIAFHGTTATQTVNDNKIVHNDILNGGGAFCVEVGAFGGVSPENTIISDNTCKPTVANTGGGYSIGDQGQGFTVSENTFDANGFAFTVAALEIVLATDGSITGNTAVNGTNGNGMVCDRCSRTTWTGNIVNGFKTTGGDKAYHFSTSVASTSVSDNTVTGNTAIFPAAGAGKGFWQQCNAASTTCNNNTYTGNHVLGVGQAGSQGITIENGTGTTDSTLVGPNQIRSVEFGINNSAAANTKIYLGKLTSVTTPILDTGTGTLYEAERVASGTATMTTALIGTLACGTTVTVAATGVATTDSISWSFNAAPAANPAELPVSSWPTANNVNFQYCNPTAAGVTPNAATLNWRVVR